MSILAASAKRKVDEVYPSGALPEGSAKREQRDPRPQEAQHVHGAAPSAAAQLQQMAITAAQAALPSPAAVLPTPKRTFPPEPARKSRPSTHNLTHKLTVGIERTYTRISSKTNPPDMEKRLKYKPVEFLAEGTKNAVYKGRMKDGKFVAIKYSVPCKLPPSIKVQQDATSHPGACDPLDTRSQARFDHKRFAQDELSYREAVIEVQAVIALQKARHVIKPFAAFESAPYERALVLEYVPKDLCDHCIEKEFGCTLKEIAIIGIQILEFLSDVQRLGYIYRDLKLENIGLFPDTLKIRILDFDSCAPLAKKHYLSSFGTFGYHAPELLIGKDYDQSVDIWSFGILLHELFTKHFPVARKDGKFPAQGTFQTIHDNLHSIVSLIGPPHESFTKDSINGHLHFKVGSGKCELLYPPTEGALILPPNFIETDIRKSAAKKGEPKELTDAFISLVQTCLQWDPARRPPAEKLLSHPFFAMVMKAVSAPIPPPTAAAPKDSKDEKES